MSAPNFIPYASFNSRVAPLKEELLAACDKVISSGMYILGPEVDAFEKEVATYCETRFAVGVANGTEALILSLKALNIGPGDEVITVSHSFVATAAAIALVGATPVFVDITADLNIDPLTIEAAITNKTKAIIPVHIGGRPAKMDIINSIADKHKLFVIEDAAQAIGTKYKGRKVGSWGTLGSFSLHPLKNLFAFGDAGVITTNDETLVQKLKLLRNIGLKNRNECVTWSSNQRLDELQAALLRVNLRHLDGWLQERRVMAEKYNQALSAFVTVPLENKDEWHTHQTYTVLANKRDELFTHLTNNQIEAKVYYPLPIHKQEAAKYLEYTDGDLPITDQLMKQIISLPLYPGLTESEQSRIIQLIKGFYENKL